MADIYREVINLSIRLTEKYRPKTWDDVVGRDKIIKKIRAVIGREDRWGLTPFLFVGITPGCGKTTIAELIAKQLGLKMHEFNASDERGINFIRNKIKQLSEYMAGIVIFLDEADSLTPEAQNALRRIMEKSKNAVFILTGNYEDRIIDPILSRCSIHRFAPLSKSAIEKRIIHIIRNEKISLGGVTPENRERVKAGINALIDRANGDLRTAIHELEQIIDETGTITPESVATLSDATSLHVMALRYALGGNFEAAKDTIEKAHVEGAYNPRLTFRELYKALESVDDKQIRIRLYSKLGEIEANSKRGSDPIIQVIAFMAYVWTMPHRAKCPLLSA